jgi:hypothetical protein
MAKASKSKERSTQGVTNVGERVLSNFERVKDLADSPASSHPHSAQIELLAAAIADLQEAYLIVNGFITEA